MEGGRERELQRQPTLSVRSVSSLSLSLSPSFSSMLHLRLDRSRHQTSHTRTRLSLSLPSLSLSLSLRGRICCVCMRVAACEQISRSLIRHYLFASPSPAAGRAPADEHGDDDALQERTGMPRCGRLTASPICGCGDDVMVGRMIGERAGGQMHDAALGSLRSLARSVCIHLLDIHSS